MEKAFDNGSLDFIESVLRLAGFNETIRCWTNILLKEFRGTINHVGNFLSYIDMARGARQGYPIYSLFLVMCIEILLKTIRCSKDILPFRFDQAPENIFRTMRTQQEPAITTKTEAFADNCSLIRPYDEGTTANVKTSDRQEWEQKWLKKGVRFMTPIRWDNLYARNAHLKCNQRIKWEENRISIGLQELNWLHAKYQPHGDPILSLS